MTTLTNLNVRNSINIDSYERAIVYAAISLKAAYSRVTEADQTDKRIQIGHQISSRGAAQIIIKAELGFDYEAFLAFGGEITRSLFRYENILPPKQYFRSPASVPETPKIQEIDNKVIESFEEYLYVCCCALRNSLPFDDQNIRIAALQTNNSLGILRIEASLPFDYSAWLNNQNYISAVSRMVAEYAFYRLPPLRPSTNTNTGETTSTNLTNDSQINNQFILAN